jgi:hypothetical protein
LSTSEARSIFNKISEKTPSTSIYYELLEEEKESSPEQEEKVLIAKSQPLQSQGLAINPEPSIPQNPNPQEKKKVNLLKFLMGMICLMLILGIVLTLGSQGTFK